jgi:hypothetical protein
LGAQVHRSDKENLIKLSDLKPNFGKKKSHAVQFISGAKWGFKNQGRKEKD